MEIEYTTLLYCFYPVFTPGVRLLLQQIETSG